MKQKIAILGAGGMLGSMVLDVFARASNYSILATFRNIKEIKHLKEYKNVEYRELDVADVSEKALKKALGGAKWVINCIGIIKPYVHDDNAAEVERAVHINALFPHELARAVAPAKIIQIATDCVYSGNKGGYKESDPHDALDVYGKSKSIGEAYCKNMYNIRCSIIGPELTAHLSLMDWFLTRPKGAKIKGFKNHLWNGITTYHFAKICLGIIKKNVQIKHVQHIVPSGKIIKSDMLKIFASEFHRQDIKIIPSNASQKIDRTLKTEKRETNIKVWQAAGYLKIPSISKMVTELARYIAEQK